MTVVRTFLAVFFVLAGLGGIVSAIRRGDLFVLVVAMALLGLAVAVWPRTGRSRA
jgi:hypothetical protein